MVQVKLNILNVGFYKQSNKLAIISYLLEK
jgi:hypothetical protein